MVAASPGVPAAGTNAIVRRVREYEVVDVPISELLSEGRMQIDPAVTGKGYFDVQLKKDVLRLKAGGWVGLIPLNERVMIDVRPRAPISNVAHLLRVADHAPTLLETAPRKYAHDFNILPSLREVYARALIDALAPVQARGLLRGYDRRQAATSSPRGRIVLGARTTQLASIGQSPRVTAAWFERTGDIPANRCLKFAVWFLAAQLASDPDPGPGIRQLIRGLNQAYRLFDGVTLERQLPLRFMADPIVRGLERLPTTRAYYGDAIAIAGTVARNLALALDQPGADVRLPPLVLDMDMAFENYVRAVLQASDEFPASELRVLDGNGSGKKLLFDSEPSDDAQPDIVVTSESSEPGRAVAIADVKYKPATGARPPRADLNQVIAYASTYRADHAVVIQPRAHGSTKLHLDRLGGISDLSVYRYVFDLDADDLAEEEDALIATIANLAQGGGVSTPTAEVAA